MLPAPLVSSQGQLYASKTITITSSVLNTRPVMCDVNFTLPEDAKPWHAATVQQLTAVDRDSDDTTLL
jgi:hypothetical protein